MTDAPTETAPATMPVDGQELATLVAAKLCHDFVSPSGAILSGLDLLSDPSAQDMRDDAMDLIGQSARKLSALVHFCRVAFGAATTSERFTSAELHKLVTDLNAGGRATLDWQVDEADLAKPAARALVNLAYLALAALPSGGVATITSHRDGDRLILSSVSLGNRARFKPEALVGLSGERLSDGLTGQWVQPYWLWLTAHTSGGTLSFRTDEGRVEMDVTLPF